MRSYQRICEICGAQFTARWPRRRRCGGKCAHQRDRRLASEPPPVEGARWVPLTKGMFALVDQDDFDDVSQWNWSVMQCKSGLWYAVRGRSDKILLHRYLFRAGSGEKVDHRDGNGLNNRRENLRAANSAQNSMNMKARLDGISRFKGVWRPSRWRATIRVDRKTIHLGSFTTEEAAALAYDEAARRLFGEFASVNFPRDGERSALHD